jgi:hypothetical protein
VEPLTVAPCSHDAATFAVMHWHYSRRMPVGKLVKYGAWEGDEFVGAVIYGRGAAPELGTPYGLTATGVCELVRVAMRDHAAPVTQVVARTLKLLKQDNPGLRLVVSFADENEGHVGVIYQAGNWVYAGASHHEWIRVHGRLVHPKSLHSKYGVGGQSIPWLRHNVDPRAERVPMPPKHRYLYPLDRAMRRFVTPLARPYPRRDDMRVRAQR